MMHIVAIAWIYVVLMMSITESSIVAGIMTFLLYGVLPLSIILYLISTPARKRRRQALKNIVANAANPPVQKEVLPQGNVSDMTPRN